MAFPFVRRLFLGLRLCRAMLLHELADPSRMHGGFSSWRRLISHTWSPTSDENHPRILLRRYLLKITFLSE